MSIEDEIVDRVQQKMLFPLLPQAVGAPVRRALFVEEWLWKELNSQEGDEEWERRIAKVRADLEVFVTEEAITPKYLFLLFKAVEGVWEIRCVRDDPSIRVLGLFPLEDVFVSTNFARRDALGGWNSRSWRDVKVMARAMWRKLFFTYQPKITTSVKEVCSGATDEIFYQPMKSSTKNAAKTTRDIAYYRQRFQNRVFSKLVSFIAEEAQRDHITKKQMAERLGKDPGQLSRLLSQPSNLTLDTISDLLLALDAEAEPPEVVRFEDRVAPNYVHPLIARVTQSAVVQVEPKKSHTAPTGSSFGKIQILREYHAPA